MIFIIIYFIMFNFLGYALFYTDKKRAIKNQWRISENGLLLVAFMGGAVGSYYSMKKNKHKTRHKKFTILVPIFIVTNFILLIGSLYLYYLYI